MTMTTTCMKAKFSKLTRSLSLISALVWAIAPRASAQTPAVLTLQPYAGLTITGAVGTVYSIEYITDLAQTNNASAWRCLEFLKLPASPYLWADKSAPATGRRFYRAVAMEAPMEMVFIPPGTFRMGSPSNEVDRLDTEGPQTDVIISQGFWMGKYEVTHSKYLEMMKNNPSHFAGDTNLPVEQVSWFDATNYCGQLTQRERAAGRIPTNCAYRLPTEAEREYACRGWTSDRRFSYGDDPGYTSLPNYAWTGPNSNMKTHPVGQKLPNPWGLYDIHGNVDEWCLDWGADNLPGGVVVDPTGPAAGSGVVVRGGCFGNSENNCRSAARGFVSPETRLMFVGFRAVLAPARP